MRIAFIGQKGVPATFGGVEYHVEELAARLAAKGHDVTAYVRDWYTPREQLEYRGIKLKHAPTIQTKHLDAFIHSLTSSTHSISRRYDVVHYHAIGPCFFSWMPRISRLKTVATIHRFDYDAAKWSRNAQYFLKTCERIALKVPHRTIVVAKHQKEYYKTNGYDVTYIPNGVLMPEPIEPQEITSRYALRGGDYILFMGRLVPEKRVDWLIDSYLELEEHLEDIKLVIAGGSSATDGYVSTLHQRARQNQNIVFTDYVTGRLKAELLSNTCLFVIPSALEGLPIALLEAMSYGSICLASDIPPHGEVITDSENGFLFSNSRSDLAQSILRLTTLESPVLSGVGKSARQHMARDYGWEDVVNKVEEIYRSV